MGNSMNLQRTFSIAHIAATTNSLFFFPSSGFIHKGNQSTQSNGKEKKKEEQRSEPEKQKDDRTNGLPEHRWTLHDNTKFDINGQNRAR